MKIIASFIGIMALLAVMASCSSSMAQEMQPTPLPTASNIGPVDIAATMMQVEIASKATQQSLQIQQTATANVLGVTATMQAASTQQAVTQQARIDAQATDAQARRDAQATQARIDADATQAQANRDAQATQAQARLDLQATQQSQATATAYMATAAIQPTADALTMTAVSQEIILRDNAVELSNQHIRDQQMTTLTRNFLLPSVILIAVVVLALAIIRSSRTRVVTNEDGGVEAILHDNTRVIRPRLMPGAVIDIRGRETTMPLLVAPSEQAEVTKRAQGVEALAVMPSEPARGAADVYSSIFNVGSVRPRYEVLEGDDLPPAGVIDAEGMKAAESDWKNE